MFKNLKDVRKRDNAVCHSLTILSKDPFVRVMRTRNCLVKVKCFITDEDSDSDQEEQDDKKTSVRNLPLFDENGRKLSKRVENTVGKGEIARYEQFLLNFSFSLSVFKRLVSQWRQKVSLCGNGLTEYILKIRVRINKQLLTHSHTMTPFDVSGKEAYSKHCGKSRKSW